MKNIDLDLTPPIINGDPNATMQLSMYTAKLRGILKLIVDNLGIKVVETAPASGELSTIGDGRGNVISEVVILNDATQSNRKLYYKDSAGNLRLIDSA